MENNAPLISVTMTTYNNEKYISEAIQSVLDESFTEFELRIGNDGSTDKPEEIVKTFRVVLFINKSKYRFRDVSKNLVHLLARDV